MADLVKIKGIKGKQNKKKWRKNIDVSGLLQHIEQKHNQQMREKFASPLIVESDFDNVKKPLDPNRFKSKGVPLPKPKYSNKIHKQDLLAESIQDPWVQTTQINNKYKKSQIPAIIKPSTGHSYNPDEKAIKEIIENVIDYEGPKQKKTKKIKKTQFKQQEIRHRNKNVRAQQLQMRQRKANKLLMHELNSHKKIAKQLDQKMEEIQTKIQEKQQKKKKLEKQALTGKVRYGKKIGKLQYKYREELPDVQETGKKISHVGGNESLIRDRFDSIYRRGIFEPRVIKVHANRTKNIVSRSKIRQD